jgi:hypothetical protein
LYRYFFESYPHSTDNWRRCYNDCLQNLDETEKKKVIQAIHNNDFSETVREQFTNSRSRQLIEFYTNYRNAIVKQGTDLFKLKQEYDKNPTIEIRRKKYPLFQISPIPYSPFNPE